MVPSTSSYLSNKAIFHFHDCGRKRVHPGKLTAWRPKMMMLWKRWAPNFKTWNQFFGIKMWDFWVFSQPKNEALSSWWFQPLWKILVKLDHFPKVRDEHKKYLKPPPSFWWTTVSKPASLETNWQLRSLLQRGQFHPGEAALAHGSEIQRENDVEVGTVSQIYPHFFIGLVDASNFQFFTRFF